ncbi:Hypothetical protein BROD_0764 [Brucella sp. NF 2653]|nr:Hypothetical protein BROD_0764 [Brucella sp. NF 2653]
MSRARLKAVANAGQRRIPEFLMPHIVKWAGEAGSKLEEPARFRLAFM